MMIPISCPGRIGTDDIGMRPATMMRDLRQRRRQWIQLPERTRTGVCTWQPTP